MSHARRIPRAAAPSFTHGDWIQVYIDPDDNPDPTRRGPGYVRIEERYGAPGVAVLPLAGDHIGMVEVFRRPPGVLALEIPRGFGGEGNGPRSDAVRELREETGLLVTEAELIDMGTIFPNSGILAAEVALFAVVLPAPVETEALDHNEINSFQWMPRRQLIDGLVTGTIKDAFTHAAVLRAAGRQLIELS
jgi:8-oxo-dGTP pyrophosphatase MutT (NUDIX family)